jgi:hypothetical protein
MNQIAEVKVEGILEVIVKQVKGIKECTIYASRIGDNGSWKYIRQNGQILCNKTHLNPQEMAEALKIAYRKKNLEGEIHWKYNNQNHKSYSISKKNPTVLLTTSPLGKPLGW